MFIQVLNDDQTEGIEFPGTVPFVIRVEGGIGEKVVKLESRRTEGDYWLLEWTFSDLEPSFMPITVPNDALRFRVVTDTVGITAWRKDTNFWSR